MPVAGTGFISGGETLYVNGLVTETWLNRALVQVWKVEWTDGEEGELELADLCTYATNWDAARVLRLV